MKNFGEFIRCKRISVNITGRQMADHLGVQPSHITRIEKGMEYPPNYEKLEKLSEILMLNESDRDTMFDLAGKARNVPPPDLAEYITNNTETVTLLRTTKNLNATSEDMQEMVKFLQNKRLVERGESIDQRKN